MCAEREDRTTQSRSRSDHILGMLDRFEGSDATDAYINARFVPQRIADHAVPFEQQDLGDLPPEHRPRPRHFTVRQWDERAQTLVIDFVVHGATGSGSREARNAS